jgi:hypothetical protein
MGVSRILCLLILSHSRIHFGFVLYSLRVRNHTNDIRDINGENPNVDFSQTKRAYFINDYYIKIKAV